MKVRLAFTLTELLVVIGIIATLASLLFPTFIRAKKKAYTGVATSNLRQLYVAGEIYRGEHDLREFPHTSLFANSESLRPLLRHKYDSYKTGLANAHRQWIIESFPNSSKVYRWKPTSYVDSVIHFRDVFYLQAEPTINDDTLDIVTKSEIDVVMVLHQSFEPSRCSPSPFGVWGTHLRVTDSGSISSHFVDFESKLTTDNTLRSDCNPSAWFK